MKKRYVLHRGDYGIRENEALYHQMAKKGWLLDKRGKHISRFRKDEPQERFYRIVLRKPTRWNEKLKPVETFENEGWELVEGKASTDRLQIYSTDDEAIAQKMVGPELTIKSVRALRKSYLIEIFFVFSMFLLQVWLLSLIGKGDNGTGFSFIPEMLLFFVEHTAFGLLFGFLTLWVMIRYLYILIYLTRFIFKLKDKPNTMPYPPRYRISFGSVIYMLTIMTILFIGAVEIVGTVEYEMPEQRESGYLILKDFSHEGERESLYYVRRWRTLLANITETQESIDGAWLNQKVYELQSKDFALQFSEILMKTATFDRSVSSFESYSVEGTDRAYAGKMGLEYILVKDSTVIKFIYAGKGGNVPNNDEAKSILEIAAAKF
ncbi:DUF2812 domain-containing protein [Alkalibacter mobilis]|uniref:DUF2812 domain-containing protein n=1 Tax=Alkalibacter mobilis TaxID=2787712 RepID=UPI0018A0C68E|nr:DUF2812 domain-containing protein [Alkalibacter mobilis]MBF7097272.1 DUF2812 domain-containing protein [Alkalibacter mobilis]